MSMCMKLVYYLFCCCLCPSCCIKAPEVVPEGPEGDIELEEDADGEGNECDDV